MTTSNVDEGAIRLVAGARAAGIEVCFANPGTTELPVVAALDRVGGIRAVLGLFEGVVTGAADGYGRIAGKPAMTLLHLGPGLANGIANLHNARRARSPIVNIVGQHATWHSALESPLASDISALASVVSGWYREVDSSKDIDQYFRDAVIASLGPPAQVSTLIVPMDFLWAKSPAGGTILEAHSDRSPAVVEDARISEVAARLLKGEEAVLYIGGLSLSHRGLIAAARIRQATGCRLFSETFSAYVDRGRNTPWVTTLPYFPERARGALNGATTVVVAGAEPPVSMFADRLHPSSLIPEGSSVILLAQPGEDAEGALESVAGIIGCPPILDWERPKLTTPSQGQLSDEIVGAAIASLLPEGAIVIDEAGSCGTGYTRYSPSAAPHARLGVTGGAIGMGLPVAIGAAVAAPERRIVALQADGSAMYTLQSLWTMAREQLNVTVVVFSNGAYQILHTELLRAGVRDPGPIARSLVSLEGPPIGWVSIGEGLGIHSIQAIDASDFVNRFRDSLGEPGPHLIEVPLD